MCMGITVDPRGQSKAAANCERFRKREFTRCLPPKRRSLHALATYSTKKNPGWRRTARRFPGDDHSLPERGQGNDDIWTGGAVTEYILLFIVSDNSRIQEKLISQGLCFRLEFLLGRETSSLGIRPGCSARATATSSEGD